MKIKNTGANGVQVNGVSIGPNEVVELDDATAKALSSSPNFELVGKTKAKTKTASKKAKKVKGGE